MMVASKRDNETERLEALHALKLLDTPGEERFDRFVRVARRLFDVPVAYIALIDEDRQWFKSVHGLSMQETPREVAFCDHTIFYNEMMVVKDALADERFADNPMVVGEPHIRFYAGFPIRSRSGHPVGTVCLVDFEPRAFDAQDEEMLLDLARMVESEVLLHNLATIDDLTGLSNRRGMHEIGSHALSICQRVRKPASLMFFDLDGFKQVNDTFGHATGDRVLMDIGRMLLAEFRNSDVVARLGGDEFCVLLTGTDATQTERPLQNLADAVAAQNAKTPYEIGFSVGTVTFDRDRHSSIKELLDEADQLMYAQKNRKKGL